MLLTNNTTDHKQDSYGYIESVPDWSLIAANVGNGFITFTLIGIGFLILHMICVLILLKLCYNRKIKSHRFHVSQCMTVAMSSICTGACLSFDPYTRWNKLPIFLTNVLEQLAGACAIVAFISMQTNLIKIAPIRIKWNKLQTCLRMVLLLVVYCTSVVILEAILYFNCHLTSIRLFLKLQFVVLSVYSCVCFLCTGFKTSLYLEQVRASNKQNERNNDNSLSDSESDSNQLIESSHRASRKETREDTVFPYMHETLRTFDTTTESAENDTTEKSERKYARSKLKSKRTVTKYSKSKLKTSRNPNIKLGNIKDRDSSNLSPGHRPSRCESSEVTVSTETNSSFHQDIHSETFQLKSLKSDEEGRQSTGSHMTEQPLIECSDFQVEMNDNDQHGDETTANIPPGVNRPHTNTDYKSDTDNEYPSSYNDSIDENGYLADGENVNFVCPKRQSSTERDSVFSNMNLFKGESFSVFQRNRRSFSSKCSRVRLRRCLMLQRLVSIAYFTTFTVVVKTIFHLYSIVGAYGILGTQKAPKPWPWFLFQILHRFVDFTLVASLLVSMVIVLRNRPRRRKPCTKHNPI